MKKAIISLLGVWVLVCANFITTGISSGAYIVSSDPDNGTTDVSVETWITIRFNTTMDRASVEENLEINPDLDPYGYRLEWDNDDTELTIKPNAALGYDKSYAITFSGAEDEDGNPLEAPFVVTFETETESGTIAGSGSEIPRFLILIIFFLIFGLIMAFLLGFWLFGKRA
jgi:hypothetical protein